MKVPKSGPDISKKWVDYILKEHKAATNTPCLLQVDNITVRKDLGDGYNSQVVFFAVETTEKNDANSPEEKKTYNLVAKLLNLDPQSKVFNQKFKSTLKEYLVYTELIKSLNKILSDKAPDEPQISLPKLIYGKCIKDQFVLVMENIEYTGYEMNDKRKGLDGQQLMAAVDKLARIHALSYVLHNTSDISKYSCFPSVGEYMSFLTIVLKSMLNNVVVFLKGSKETEELGKKVQLSIPSLMERTNSALTSNYSIKCLVHGDFWNNNFMFKYADAPDGQRIIEDVNIIDWGNCCWGTPLFDLQYLVQTSTTRSVRREHLNEVLSHYHTTFTTLLTLLGYPLPNWGLTELKAEWQTAYPAGLLLGCALTQGTLSTKNPFRQTQHPEPSILDKPPLVPIKLLLDGMKVGMAKVFLHLSLSSSGQKVFTMLTSKLMTPILDELRSGENEVMTTRLLDLLYEADENGVFST